MEEQRISSRDLGHKLRSSDGNASQGSAGLFIGINDFRDGNIVKLDFAVNDAISLAHFFVVERRWMAPSRCKLVLRGTPTRSRESQLEELRQLGCLITNDALRSDILGHLEWLKSLDLKDSDVLFCSIATHGFPDQEPGRSEPEDYVVPYDADGRHLAKTSVPLKWVHENLVGSGAGRRFTLVDACRVSLVKGIRSVGNSSSDFGAIFDRGPGQATLMACKPNQYSRELTELESGVCAHELLAAMHEGDAFNASGEVTPRQLGLVLPKRMKDLAEHHKLPAQEPVFRECGDAELDIVIGFDASRRREAEQQERQPARRVPPTVLTSLDIAPKQEGSPTQPVQGPSLPPVPQAIVQLEERLNSLQETIDLLERGVHPDIRECWVDVTRHKTVDGKPLIDFLKNTVQTAPDTTLAALCSRAPEVPSRAILSVFHGLRQLIQLKRQRDEVEQVLFIKQEADFKVVLDHIFASTTGDMFPLVRWLEFHRQIPFQRYLFVHHDVELLHRAEEHFADLVKRRKLAVFFAVASCIQRKEQAERRRKKLIRLVPWFLAAGTAIVVVAIIGPNSLFVLVYAFMGGFFGGPVVVGIRSFRRAHSDDQIGLTILIGLGGIFVGMVFSLAFFFNLVSSASGVSLKEIVAMPESSDWASRPAGIFTAFSAFIGYAWSVGLTRLIKASHGFDSCMEAIGLAALNVLGPSVGLTVAIIFITMDRIHSPWRTWASCRNLALWLIGGLIWTITDWRQLYRLVRRTITKIGVAFGTGSSPP